MDTESLTNADLDLLITYLKECLFFSSSEELYKNMRDSKLLYRTKDAALRAFFDISGINYEIINLALNNPLEDIPLNINSSNKAVRAIVKWRLSIGK